LYQQRKHEAKKQAHLQNKPLKEAVLGIDDKLDLI